MLKYFEVMYAEMKVWISDAKCRFNTDGDDQLIHLYLVYSGQLPFATAIPNRAGIMNTIGTQGRQIAKAHKEFWGGQNVTHRDAMQIPYEGSSRTNWLGPEHGLTNAEGMFTNLDGTISRAIHKFDFFGSQYGAWLNRQSFGKDPMPKSYVRSRM